jgi:hypothetical protein
MCAHNQSISSEDTQTHQNFDKQILVIVYPSWTMKNALASLVNLLTLFVGIAIGIMLAPHVERPVRAVASEAQQPVTAPNLPAPTQVGGAVTPTQIGGIALGGESVGTYLFLAHHIQSDELVVNGIDLLKLQQGEINLLARMPFVNPQELSGIVRDARAKQIYQFNPSAKNPAPQPK